MKRALLTGGALAWCAVGVVYAVYAAHKALQFHPYYNLDSERQMVEWTFAATSLRVLAGAGCVLAALLAAASRGRTRYAAVVGLALDAFLIYQPSTVLHQWHDGLDTLGPLQLSCALASAQALLALLVVALPLRWVSRRAVPAVA